MQVLMLVMALAGQLTMEPAENDAFGEIPVWAGDEECRVVTVKGTNAQNLHRLTTLVDGEPVQPSVWKFNATGEVTIMPPIVVSGGMHTGLRFCGQHMIANWREGNYTCGQRTIAAAPASGDLLEIQVRDTQEVERPSYKIEVSYRLNGTLIHRAHVSAISFDIAPVARAYGQLRNPGVVGRFSALGVR